MEKENLADIQYWEKGNEIFKLSPMPVEYPTVQMLYKYLGNPEKDSPKTVLEIGVYPGRFIYHFGKAGYVLNGIDQSQYLPSLTQWLQENDFKIGAFQLADVTKIDQTQKYDVVFSAGFIEHFVQFESMIELHAQLTKPGGYVFITAPNFGGRIQNWLHSTLDRENLERHYVPSMDVDKWAAVLAKNDCEIIEAGYIGNFDFWVDNQHRNPGQKILLKLVKLLMPLLKKMKLPNKRSYSPECVIIARKKK